MNTSSEIPTVLKKRDAHDLKLKETGAHLMAGSSLTVDKNTGFI